MFHLVKLYKKVHQVNSSRIWKVGSLGINVKRMLYEKIVVPTVLYGAMIWGLNAREKRRLNVKDVKWL